MINAEREIAEKLKIPEDEFVYYIVRARYADKVPYVMEYTYMPIDLIPGVKFDTLKGSNT